MPRVEIAVDRSAPVLVVGASGFIGSAVVAALRSAGRITVAPSRQESASRSASFRDALVAAQEVVWLAGRASPRLAEREPRVAWQEVDLLRSVLALRDAARRAARFTLISSGGTVYDARHPAPYDETAPLRPTGVYGRTRVALEGVLSDAWRKGDCIVRVANAYGPGQRVGDDQGVVAHWLDAAIRKEPLRLTVPPGTRRDFVYIADVARAFVRLGNATTRPRVVNIGSGEPTSLAELAAVISALLGGGTRLVGAAHAEADEIAATWLDVRLARDSLGWAPLVSLRDGLAMTLDATRGAAQQATT